MTEASLQALLSTKAALDLGLVTQADFEGVKQSFLRAQQLKAAIDAGLVEDVDSSRQAFLASLLGSSAEAAPLAAAATAPAPPAAPAPARAPPPAPPAQAPPAPQQQQAAEAPAPPPRPAPQAWQIPPPASPAVAALARKPASNPGVPSNIPKMGGRKAAAAGTSMSGIAVTEDAVNLFYLMRLKATYKWALWQVDDAGTQVIIAAVGDRESTWADFLAALPDADCRYGVFDFDFSTPDGQKLHKMIFLNWAPDSARVKAKMMYASTKDFFKGQLDGLSLEFQASDLDEISEQEVGDAVRAIKRG